MSQQLGMHPNLATDFCVYITLLHSEEDRYAMEIINKARGFINPKKSHDANDMNIGKLIESLKSISPEIVIYSVLIEKMKTENLIDAMKISTEYKSLFINGYYNKYSREISQSPWPLAHGGSTPINRNHIVNSGRAY